MSGPAEWPTNLYQIGKTESIPWTAYEIRTRDAGETVQGPKVGHVDPANLLRITDALLELRNQSLHLFFDVQASTVWHFDCLHKEAPKIDASKVIPRRLTTDALEIKRTTQGVLKVKDVVTESINGSLYEHLARSILLSALNGLASQPGYFSLGLHANSSDTNSGIQAVYGTNIHDPGELLSLWSLQLRWYPSGEMVLSISEYSSDRYLFLSQILPSHSREAHTLHNINVRLLPHGRLAAYVGSAPTSFVESRKGNVENIRRIGLSVSEADAWVVVKLDGLQSSKQLLWPAKLSVVSINGLFHNSLDNAETPGSTNDRILDPVREVEIWYTQKGEREKAITARIQREEAEQRQKEAQQASQDHQDRLDFRSPAANLLSTHDASGIYPTPPDVLIHHAPHQDNNDARIQDEEHLNQGRLLARALLERADTFPRTSSL